MEENIEKMSQNLEKWHKILKNNTKSRKFL